MSSFRLRHATIYSEEMSKVSQQYLAHHKRPGYKYIIYVAQRNFLHLPLRTDYHLRQIFTVSVYPHEKYLYPAIRLYHLYESVTPRTPKHHSRAICPV